MRAPPPHGDRPRAPRVFSGERSANPSGRKRSRPRFPVAAHPNHHRGPVWRCRCQTDFERGVRWPHAASDSECGARSRRTELGQAMPFGQKIDQLQGQRGWLRGDKVVCVTDCMQKVRQTPSRLLQVALKPNLPRHSRGVVVPHSQRVRKFMELTVCRYRVSTVSPDDFHNVRGPGVQCFHGPLLRHLHVIPHAAHLAYLRRRQ